MVIGAVGTEVCTYQVYKYTLNRAIIEMIMKIPWIKHIINYNTLYLQ